MNLLFVAGEFNDEGGRPSVYARRLFNEILPWLNSNVVCYRNGGFLDDLYPYFDGDQNDFYDVIIWMPSVPNDVPKTVDRLKKVYPYSILVISKHNPDRSYSTMHLLGRALKAKANLLIEFYKKDSDSKIWSASILDPLGNNFTSGPYHSEENQQNIANALAHRLRFLTTMKRVRSIKINGPVPEVPNEEQFFTYARHYAEKFHELIHADTDRMLGNVSFRCEAGFPSFKEGDLIFVSKRNVDKRDIGANSFVPVIPQIENDCFQYYDDDKPSVDTPIQIALYNYYPNIRYMLHSHTYVQDAKPTTNTIPCGAMQEVDEIKKLFPDKESKNFCVNLLGHGSLVLASDLAIFENIPYIARKLPRTTWV